MKNQTQPTAVPSKAKKPSKASVRAGRMARARTASDPTNFSGHIGELRRRMFWVAFVFILASAAAYNYKDPLLQVVMAPLHGEKLTYLTPAGGFSFIFQISMYAGLFAALPLLIYHLHGFIKPALPVRAQRSAGRVVVAAMALICSGIAYGYFVAIPAALEFLTSFASEAVTPNLTADSYLSFFLAYVAGIAGLSLLPLVLMFIHWIKPQTPMGLLKSERWVIAGAFIVAAIITPTPDAVNQTMIAVPVIIIYQLGVIGILISLSRQRKRDRADRHRLQPSSQSLTPTPPAYGNKPASAPGLATAAVAAPAITPAKSSPLRQPGVPAMDVYQPPRARRSTTTAPANNVAANVLSPGARLAAQQRSNYLQPASSMRRGANIDGFTRQYRGNMPHSDRPAESFGPAANSVVMGFSDARPRLSLDGLVR